MLFDPRWEAKPVDAVGEVLLAAAGIIETYGHCVGSLGNERIGYCVLGAIKRALAGTQFPYNGYQKILERIFRVLGHCSIATFNDTHTALEAIYLLRAAAR